jgi:deoxyribose-phosphate aldolase
LLGSAVELARLIDHTLLTPTANAADIDRLCEEAKLYSFHSVCVNPCYVTYASEQLKGSGVSVCTVIDFPLGAATGAMKMMEAVEAAHNGANELDFVMSLGFFKSDGRDLASRQMKELVLLTRDVVHKVIIEACYLTDEEKRQAALMVADSGAEFVKTSTGFGPGGATVADVRLIKEAVSGRCRVKAAGGIRDLAALSAMVEAGADRIGTSSGVAIIEEYLKHGV